MTHDYEVSKLALELAVKFESPDGTTGGGHSNVIEAAKAFREFLLWTSASERMVPRYPDSQQPMYPPQNVQEQHRSVTAPSIQQNTEYPPGQSFNPNSQ